LVVLILKLFSRPGLQIAALVTEVLIPGASILYKS